MCVPGRRQSPGKSPLRQFDWAQPAWAVDRIETMLMSFRNQTTGIPVPTPDTGFGRDFSSSTPQRLSCRNRLSLSLGNRRQTSRLVCACECGCVTCSWAESPFLVPYHAAEKPSLMIGDANRSSSTSLTTHTKIPENRHQGWAEGRQVSTARKVVNLVSHDHQECIRTARHDDVGGGASAVTFLTDADQADTQGQSGPSCLTEIRLGAVFVGCIGPSLGQRAQWRWYISFGGSQGAYGDEQLRATAQSTRNRRRWCCWTLRSQ